MCLKHICHICNLKWKCVTAGRHQFQNWYWWLFDTNFKNVIDCWMTPISNWYKLLASTILRIELPLEFTVEQFFVRNWLKFHDMYLPLLDENWTCSNDKSYVISLQITNTCNVWMCLKHICHICNLILNFQHFWTSLKL